MQASQQPSNYCPLPALSSSSSTSDLALVPPTSDVSCQQHRTTSASGSTCCTTPPEHTYSCPSSVASSFLESSNSNTGSAFALSPRIQSELLYPPAPQLSTIPFPITTSSNKAAPYHTQQQHAQSYHQHHLPKSLSRSSISSDGSTLLFSPIQEPPQLHHYSPLTPPLSLPADSNKALSTSGERQPLPLHIESSSTAKPTNKLPLLPNIAGGGGENLEKVTRMATTAPAVMEPGCISQLATYLAEMVVYLWFSPPGKKAPAFPRPTLSFARFCHDILTTTQVSQSVVVLALYFISKLQAKHSIEPRPWSEYKLAIASLMLANKILDDHTYTNKTWSEVSGLPLDVLNGAEVEFLQGLEFDLHVSHTAYKAWYTMLQNGESSNIVKQSQPARKKARLINPIAPSAPTSPIHHTSSSSTSPNAAVGFDFNTRTQAPSNVSIVHPNAFALQIPMSRHSFNAWPIAPQMPDAALMQTSFSQNVPTASASGTSQYGTRKRRASDAALSPPQSSMTALARSSHPSLQISTSHLPQLQPEFLHGIPAHAYTPIISTPASAMSHVPSSRATTPHSAHGPSVEQCHQQGYFPQDFMPNDLTSSWTPANRMGDRRPQDLTYYALAAGQQRGGYLTHQPLPPYPTYPVYHPGMPMHPLNGRALAPLPRNSSRNQNMTPVHQQAVGVQPRMSLSLSPVDMRQLYAQTQGAAIKAQDYSLHPYVQQRIAYDMAVQGHPSLAPPMVSNPYLTDAQKSASAWSNSTQGVPIGQGSVPTPSPLEPSLQNLVLSGAAASPGATPVASRQQQPMPPQSYYSSFANNGLPGVLSWPAQALAQYQHFVQPHQQPWPQDLV